jgi:hypothetical protein
MKLAAVSTSDIIERMARAIDALSVRVTSLEQRGGARDAADRSVVPAIALSVGGRRFTSVELLAHARVDSDLDAALVGADVTNPRELGKLLSRLSEQFIDGYRLQRVAVERDGIVWQITTTERV